MKYLLNKTCMQSWINGSEDFRLQTSPACAANARFLFLSFYPFNSKSAKDKN